MDSKKNIILALAALHAVGLSSAMQSNNQPVTNQHAEKLVTLPSAQIISTRLLHLGLHSYLEKCHVDVVLGGQQKTLKQLALSVEESLNRYDRSRVNRHKLDDTATKKQEILETILQDFPEAIAELDRTGDLYTSAFFQQK